MISTSTRCYVIAGFNVLASSDFCEDTSLDAQRLPMLTSDTIREEAGRLTAARENISWRIHVPRKVIGDLTNSGAARRGGRSSNKGKAGERRWKKTI
jgi:hypothetical protein